MWLLLAIKYLVLNQTCFYKMQIIDHVHFDSIDSTHLYARGKIHELKPNQWNLCTANSQVSGIGTKNSKWVSPADVNIYASYSFLIKKLDADKIFFIPQIACLQIVRLLQDLGIEAKIKWVNDVLVHKKKISGVLCESFSGGHEDNMAVIVSIGLNVNADANDLGGVKEIATSMKLETSQEYDLQKLIMQLSGSLFAAINSLIQSGFSQFRPVISQNLERFDATPIVLLRSQGSSVNGVIKDISDKGEIILETESGIFSYFEGSIVCQR